MDHASQTPEISTAEMYLSQIETLRAEIEAAVAAISGDDVRRLDESVARQEFLASSVSALFRQMQRPENAALPPPIRVRIVSSMNRLQVSASTYAALMQHSGKLIATLVSLCRSHTLPCAEVRGTRPARQTWSCDM